MFGSGFQGLKPPHLEVWAESSSPGGNGTGCALRLQVSKASGQEQRAFALWLVVEKELAEGRKASSEWQVCSR